MRDEPPAISAPILGDRHTEGLPARLRVRPIAAVDLALADDVRATLTSRNAHRPASIDVSSALGCTELTPGLYIGGRAIASDRAALALRSITHVLNMAAECANFFEIDCSWSMDTRLGAPRSPLDADGDAAYCASDDGNDDGSSPQHRTSIATSSAHRNPPLADGLVYMRCACTDQADDDITPHLDALTRFVRDAWSQGGKVLVHCNSGISRSSAAVLACVLRWGPGSTSARELSLFEAFKWLKERRPIASPHPTYMRQLCDYEVHLRGGNASVNPNTYHNNRYEAPDKLHASIADPWSTAKLLGDMARPQDMSPVYCTRGRTFPALPGISTDVGSTIDRKRHSVPAHVSFMDASFVEAKHRIRA